MGWLDRFSSKKGKAPKQTVPGFEVGKKTPAKPEEMSQKPVQEKARKEKKVSDDWDARREVIVRPLVTEKTASLATDGSYTFVVQDGANRMQVKEALKALYGVTPERVNIIHVRGKRVRFGRFRGTQKNWKKAVVTLPKGQSIDIYEGV